MRPRVMSCKSGGLSEWLRRWTRNPLGSARVGSNPAAVDLLLHVIFIMQGLIRCRVVVVFVVLSIDGR